MIILAICVIVAGKLTCGPIISLFCSSKLANFWIIFEYFCFQVLEWRICTDDANCGTAVFRHKVGTRLWQGRRRLDRVVPQSTARLTLGTRGILPFSQTSSEMSSSMSWINHPNQENFNKITLLCWYTVRNQKADFFVRLFRQLSGFWFMSNGPYRKVSTIVVFMESCHYFRRRISEISFQPITREYYY